MLSFLWSGAWRIPVKISPEALAVSGLSHGHTLIALSFVMLESCSEGPQWIHMLTACLGRGVCLETHSHLLLLSLHTDLTSAAETETG